MKNLESLKKAKNDKIFRRIYMEILELIRHAKAEYQDWFNGHATTTREEQSPIRIVPQVVCLQNNCMVNGSYVSTSQYSGCAWVWKYKTGQIQLMGTKNQIIRLSSLHLELEELGWAIESMMHHSTWQNFGSDCKYLISMIEDPHAWLRFSTNLEEIAALQKIFKYFKLSYIPRAQNEIVDS